MSLPSARAISTAQHPLAEAIRTFLARPGQPTLSGVKDDCLVSYALGRIVVIGGLAALVHQVRKLVAERLHPSHRVHLAPESLATHTSRPEALCTPPPSTWHSRADLLTRHATASASLSGGPAPSTPELDAAHGSEKGADMPERNKRTYVIRNDR